MLALLLFSDIVSLFKESFIKRLFSLISFVLWITLLKDVSSGIIEDADMENLENSLNKEDFAIITNDSRSIKLKFKLVELFSK